MRRRVKQAGLLVSIGIILFIAGSLILIQTSAFQQWLLRRAEALAGDAGYGLTADRLNLNIWQLQATLERVLFQDGKTITVRADRLFIDLTWDAFRRDVKRITAIEADGLAVEIQAAPGSSTPTTTQIPRIVFDRVAIRNASLNYTDAGSIIRVPSFNLDLQSGRGSLKLSSPVSLTDALQFRLPDLPLQVSDQSLDFGRSEWRADYSGTTVTGSIRGRVQWWPAVTLSMDYSTNPFTFQNWPSIASSGQVSYENSVVTISDFRADTGTGTVTGNAELKGQSKSAALTWNAVNLDPAGLPAATTGNVQLQWQAGDFTDMSGKGYVRVDSRQYGRAEADVVLRNARADLDVRANAFDATLRARIAAGLDQTISGTFDATHNRFGKARLAGSINGTFQAPRVNGQLSGTGITYNAIGPLNGSASLSITRQLASLDNIHLQLKNSVVPGGDVRIDLSSMRVTGNIRDIQVGLGDFASGVDGIAKLQASIEGNVEKPIVRMTGSSENLNISGTPVDSVQFTGEATADGLNLTDLTARQRDGSATASGTYNFKTGEIHGNMHGSGFQIDQVQDLSATVSATAEVAGTTDAPTATFNARVIDIRYRGQDHGDADVEGTIENNVASVKIESDKYTASGAAEIQLKAAPYPYSASITASRSRIAYEQYEVTANGKVAATGALSPFAAEQIDFDQFTVDGDGIHVQASGSLANGVRLAATADIAKIPVDGLMAAGEAQLQAVVTGTLENPMIEGSIETHNAVLSAAGMPEPASVDAGVDFTRNEFKIHRLEATAAGASVAVSGNGTLQGAGRFHFRAENIKPERLMPDRPITGTIAVEGDVEVAIPELAGITGSAKVTQFDLAVKEIPIHQVQPIELHFENQILATRNFAIEGLNTRATIDGNVNVTTRALNLDVDADTDLRLIEALLPGSNPGGQIRTKIAVRGTPDQPNLEGFLTLSDMNLLLLDPPVSVMDMHADIQLRGDRIQIASASGSINGGMFAASGGVDISASGLGRTAVQLTLTGAETEYPDGFQSEISSQLSLDGTGTDLEISGNVDILSGVYTRDISLAQEVFSRITSTTAPVSPIRPAEPGVIDQIRLNVTVGTPGTVSVVNNLANFEMDGAFRLRGAIGNPVIIGRAVVDEGGEIYFGPEVGVVSDPGGRRDKYVISEGSIDFNDPVRTQPSFNIVATREVQTTDERYIITLRASGTADKPKVELTSDPSLDEPDIVTLLLTGRTLEKLQGSELTFAQEQAANYLSGRFSNAFKNSGSTFRPDTVRIDPILLAQEEDFSAKLTIGKDITPDFNLVFSQNLAGPRAQTWITSYKVMKDLLVRGINRSDDNNLTIELRHDLKWGGGPTQPKASKPRDEQKNLGEVTFEGTTFETKDLTKEVTRPGKPFNSLKMNEDVRSLRRFYADHDFLLARIRAVRNPRDGRVDVRFVVDEGPSVTFAFQGAKVPKSVQEDIRQIWIRGFAEIFSLRQSQDRLLRYLRDEGYLQATLTAQDESSSPEVRRYVFAITSGPKFKTPVWIFRGVAPIDLNVTAGIVLEDPKAIQDRILTTMWKDGYLNASCTEPQLIINDGQPRFEISVERGPRFSIGTVTANYTDVLHQLPPGENGQRPAEGFFTSAWLDRAQQTIVSRYLQDGFNDVQVSVSTHVPERGVTVDVEFKIDPGPPQIVTGIEVEGNKTTNIDYVRRQFTFKEGDPLDYTSVNLTRKKLYDTRLFRRVELNLVKGDAGYIAKTKLNERPPWNFRYGFAVTDQLETSDRQFGGTADLSYANLLGKGITTGTSFKYTADLREGRVFASLPSFLGKNVTTTAYVFRSRDLSEAASIADLLGFTIQQQWQLRNRYLLSYDYRYERNHTFERDLDPDNPFAFDLHIPFARLNATLSRDSRNDILNATTGSFLSNSFAVAPPGVGSSIQFLRNYTQYLRFQPLRGRLVWASAARVGLARAFDNQQLIPKERFRAGGGTTLRAFQQDTLAEPGNSLLIVNQELRFPLFWRFSGVSFMDVGNVYPTVRDFNPLRLRYSPGAGIRIQTPLVLIRLDAGFNAFPRPGEPRYRFAFGVGQAF